MAEENGKAEIEPPDLKAAPLTESELTSTPVPSSAQHYSADDAFPESDGAKVMRWVLTDEQRTRMEAVYAKQRFPSMSLREELARDMGVTLRQVQVWFQNRRQRDGGKP